MATIEICDVCSKRETVKRLSYCYDREMGPAGSSEDVFETYDLCDACELSILKSVISKITNRGLSDRPMDSFINKCDFNKYIIEVVKTRQKK